MHIDKYLQPEFDFSRLDPLEYEESPDVTPSELMYVFKNAGTKVDDDIQYPPEAYRWFCVGFSQCSRWFELIMTTNDDGKYVF